MAAAVNTGVGRDTVMAGCRHEWIDSDVRTSED